LATARDSSRPKHAQAVIHEIHTAYGALSMDADSTARINQAVDALLERCTRSSLPHSMLRDLLKQAEANGSLTAKESAAVESAVLRALASKSKK